MLKNVTQYLEDRAEIKRSNFEQKIKDKDKQELYSEGNDEKANSDDDVQSYSSCGDLPSLNSSHYGDDDADGNANQADLVDADLDAI